MKQFFFKLFVFAFVIFSLALLNSASATDVNFNPQITIPGSKFIAGQDVTMSNSTITLCEYIRALYKYGIGIIGILAVITTTIGGVFWLTAGGSSKGISTAKTWIYDGLYGVALALLSFLILATINTNLVICKGITIAGIEQVENQGPASLYSDDAKKFTTPSSDDGSNNPFCCVIYGNAKKAIGDPDEIKTCATIVKKDKDLAQKECNSFYASWNKPAYNSTFISKLQPQIGTNNELNSATITIGACYDDSKNSQIHAWCKAMSEPDYCKSKSDGKPCSTTTGKGAYCYKNTCTPCKISQEKNNATKGEKCSESYECLGKNAFANKCGREENEPITNDMGRCNKNFFSDNNCTYQE